MLILDIAFSQFLTKEISESRNIKDRLNRQKVTSTLVKLNEYLKTAVLSNKGNFFFFGYDEYGTFVSIMLEPSIEYKGFYYSCSSTFVTDIISSYFEARYGSIIFINGDETAIYIFNNGSFQRKPIINGNLTKRQTKGGQSALRFSRLAEQSRENYITRVIDRVNDIRYEPNYEKYTIWIFGSDEMRNMVLVDKKLQVKINDGGFLNFDERTIQCSKWIEYLDIKDNYEPIYKQIEEYLNINPDILDFSPENRNNPEIKLYLGFDGIPIPKTGILSEFTYIGLKYYSEIDLELN